MIVHDTVIQFRANKKLADALAERAARDGYSISEMMRHALRDQLRKSA